MPSLPPQVIAGIAFIAMIELCHNYHNCHNLPSLSYLPSIRAVVPILPASTLPSLQPRVAVIVVNTTIAVITVLQWLGDRAVVTKAQSVRVVVTLLYCTVLCYAVLYYYIVIRTCMAALSWSYFLRAIKLLWRGAPSKMHLIWNRWLDSRAWRFFFCIYLRGREIRHTILCLVYLLKKSFRRRMTGWLLLVPA